MGVSSKLKTSNLITDSTAGTYDYMSLECMNGINYSFEADVWFLGVILYELCTLKRPFTGSTAIALANNIPKGYKPIPEKYSVEIKKLIDDVLRLEPKERLTIDQILQRDIIRPYIPKVLPSEKEESFLIVDSLSDLKETLHNNLQPIKAIQFDYTVGRESFMI